MSMDDKLQKKADEMHALSIQTAVDTIEKLQVKLAEFAKKHQSDIQDDPTFRQQFLQMCAPLGVDPLVSQKGFWAKTLGVGIGDFYYELSVKVAEVCFATRTKNGGIMAVTEVCDTLNRTRSGGGGGGRNDKKNKKDLYNTGDITIAVKKLSTLGGGFRIVTVGQSDMIVSVPTELDNDHMEIMTLAQDGQGCVTVDEVKQRLSWSEDRVERALTLLLHEGMAWKDDFHGISFYWFPSVWKEKMAIMQ
jgi:ESCRT-II complex subunit VPS22